MATATAPAPASAVVRRRSPLARAAAVVGGLGLAVVLVVAPLVSSPYINYQLASIMVFAVALLGLNVVMGWTGQVSLGQSAFLGLGAYVAAYGVVQGWPLWLSLVLSAVLPAVVGMLVALAAARLRGLALAMITIALPIVGVPLARRLDEYTGGSQGQVVSFLRAPEATGLANDQWRYYVVTANRRRRVPARAQPGARTHRPVVPGRQGERGGRAVDGCLAVPHQGAGLHPSPRSWAGSRASCTLRSCSTPRPRRGVRHLDQPGRRHGHRGSASIVGTALGALYYVLVRCSPAR